MVPITSAFMYVGPMSVALAPLRLGVTSLIANVPAVWATIGRPPSESENSMPNPQSVCDVMLAGWGVITMAGYENTCIEKSNNPGTLSIASVQGQDTLCATPKNAGDVNAPLESVTPSMTDG